MLAASGLQGLVDAVGARVADRPQRRLSLRTLGPEAVLTGLIVAAAVLSIAAFLATALFRLTYPFPLELIESAAQAQVDRILLGQPLYVQPTLEHVPLIYGPVYFYVSAVVAAVTGAAFVPLRLVSLLASVGSIAIVFGLVRRETGSVAGGLIAAGLLAACDPLVENNMDLGRVDALFMFLVLAGLWLARTAVGRTGRASWLKLAASGMAIGLAGCTKVPMAAAPVAVVLCLYVAASLRERVIAFVLALVLTVGLVSVLLRLQSGPWPTWYMLDLPRQHGFGRDLIGRFWIADTLPRFTLALALAPVFVLSRALRGDRSAAVFYSLVGLTLLGTAWASRVNGGGAQNVLLPAYAAAAIFFGLGFDEALRQLAGSTRRARAFQIYVLALGLLQFGLVAYNPRFEVPNRTQLLADQRLAQALAALPGPVFAPDMAGYLRGSDQAQQPHLGAVAELLGGYGGGMTAEGDEWQAALDRSLGQKRFRSIVLQKSDCCLKGSVRAYGYQDAGPLIRAGDDFYFWRAPWTPDDELYVLPES